MGLEVHKNRKDILFCAIYFGNLFYGLTGAQRSIWQDGLLGFFVLGNF